MAKKDNGRVRVKIIKRHGSYNPGETPGFEPATAQRLITLGFAQKYDAAAEEKLAKSADAQAVQRKAELDAREAELNKMAAELEAKAAELDGNKPGKDDGAGAPPNQGKQAAG